MSRRALIVEMDHSSRSSIRRSMLALPITSSGRGLPTWAGHCFPARAPTPASSSPTKPESGAKSSGPSTSRRS